MANVQPYVDQIRQARYGRDVRESIASGIEAMNTESEEAYNQAITSQTSCVNLAGQAQASATASSNSAAQAKQSEQNSAQIVANVQTYEASAKASATAAKQSEQNALDSAQNAMTSETNARNSELAAQTSASQSAASATASKTSESNAAQSQQSALNSANSAQNSASAASSSQTAAAQSATNAGIYAQEAKDAAAQASAIAGIGTATTTTPGIVKPDGSTIGINEFGTIYVKSEFASVDNTDPIEYREFNKIESNEAQYTFFNKLTAIAQNVRFLEKFRHSHENKEVIDKLSDKDGNLLYNEKEIIPEMITTKEQLESIVKTGTKVVEAFLIKTLIHESSQEHSEIHVHTDETDFKGLTVTATTTNPETGEVETDTAVINENGYASITVYTVNTTYKVFVTIGTDEYSTNVDVPYYSVYPIDLVKESATIAVSTLFSQLYGKKIKISKGSTTIATGALSASGTFTQNVKELGTYTVECIDSTIGSRVPPVNVTVTEFFKTFPVALEYNSAKIIAKTSETDLLGRDVTATIGGSTYRGKFPTTLTSGVATAEIEVYQKGTYTVSSTSAGGDTAEETVEVLNYNTTNEVELSLVSELVPTMTSNTTPSGEVFVSGGSFTPWKVFDNDETTFGGYTNAIGGYIGYKFVNPSLVKKVLILAKNKTDSYKIQGSNSRDTGYTDLCAPTEAIFDTITEITLNNNTHYQYYRVYQTTKSTTAEGSVFFKIQFYGR